MKTYLLWSLRQIYLSFFCPTQFKREVEGPPGDQPQLGSAERFRYLLKMLPWMIVIPVLSNLIAGNACEEFGVAFKWGQSWVGVVFGVAFGVAFPLAFWLAYFRLGSYPFDVALTGVAYLMARRQPRAAERAWRWCPVSWNEVIWLPLPFVSKLLALLAQQDRAEGLRQIAFVAAERPLQRRAAVVALAEVAVNDLRADSMSALAETTEKLNWTIDVPFELTVALMTSLPRFDRAAQQVGQYLALHSPYRKGEALKQALEEVEALQQSLIVS